MNRVSVRGRGAEIFFPQSKEGASKKPVKITFRIPLELADRFENMFKEIKKERIFFAKNKLGILAIQKLIDLYSKGQLKSDSL